MSKNHSILETCLPSSKGELFIEATHEAINRSQGKQYLERKKYMVTEEQNKNPTFDSSI